jgi:hypothetical protein
LGTYRLRFFQRQPISPAPTATRSASVPGSGTGDATDEVLNIDVAPAPTVKLVPLAIAVSEAKTSVPSLTTVPPL